MVKKGIIARWTLALAAGALACALPAEESVADLFGSAAPALATNATAAQVMAACRAMLPTRPIALKGSIVMRSRKGIPQGEYDYALTLDRAKSPAETAVTVFARGTTNVVERRTIRRPGAVPGGCVLGTDVTWLDLSLDYLWWTNPAFEAAREGETVHGQKCFVILADAPAGTPDVARVRLWADRKTGCVMQAEQLDAAGRTLRRTWGTRLKRFGARWMANVLEVEAPGSGHRTKITVEDLREK